MSRVNLEINVSIRFLLSAGVAAFCFSPALADPVEDFYKGKQLQFIIRTPVGGDYDSYSRLVARHIGKHIPGKPSFSM